MENTRYNYNDTAYSTITFIESDNELSVVIDDNNSNSNIVNPT